MVLSKHVMTKILMFSIMVLLLFNAYRYVYSISTTTNDYIASTYKNG